MATVTALADRPPAKRRRARRPPTAAPAAATVLGGTPARFAECRALGHEWHHLNNGHPATDEQLGFRRPIGVEHGSVAFISTCPCGTTRTKWLGRRGTHYPAIYRYPDGYQRRGEDERLSPTEWREAWVVKALDDLEAEA